jgi:sugar lactone lactonase YvrE
MLISAQAGFANGLIRMASLVGLLTVLLIVGVVGDAQAQNRRALDIPGTVLSFAPLDTLVLPTEGQVTGLTWLGTDTLVILADLADTLTASGDREVHLVFQDSTGTVFQDEDFSGVLDRGLAWDGEFLWSCGDADDGSSILYKIKADTLRVEEAFNTPGHRPSGICWDGRFLWITDRDSGRIDRFDPEAKDITRSVVTPGFSPFGVAWDGLHMWITDSGTGRLYRLAGSRRNWNATVDAESFMYRARDVLLLHDGKSFWMIPDGENLAIRVRFE